MQAALQERREMATIVYGKEGDQTIITRIDLGHGDEYMVECRVGAGYYCVYCSFNYEKALEHLQNCNPHF